MVTGCDGRSNTCFCIDPCCNNGCCRSLSCSKIVSDIFIWLVPCALDVVAWTGIISALFAALIACTQTDIKRVLAYSTMSQIGFMMFALGVSGYGGESGLRLYGCYVSSVYSCHVQSSFVPWSRCDYSLCTQQRFERYGRIDEKSCQ